MREPRQPKPRLHDTPRWHFRTTILDRLDEYFACIHRLKGWDPDAYARLRRIGLTIPSDVYVNPDRADVRELLAKPGTRVAFGGVTMPLSEEDPDKITPLVVYFLKLDRPGRVQRFGKGDVYEVCVMYDDRSRASGWRSKLTAVARCHIGIDNATGETTLLREVCFDSAQVHRRRRKGRSERVWLTTRHWRIPGWVVSSAADHNKTPDDWARGLLALALLTHAAAIEKIVVRVERRGEVAAFGIELARGKTFFADREREEDGRRRRIFHAVIEHERAIAPGKTTTVRAHYRGQRRFMWKGYNVGIVLPANNRLLWFSAPASKLEDVPKEKRATMIDSEDLAKDWKRALDQ